jgi:hypothetical protein
MHGGRPITITIKRTKQLSGLGLTKIYDLIKRGILKTTYVDGRHLVIYESLEMLLLPAPPAEASPRRRGRPRKARP